MNEDRQMTHETTPEHTDGSVLDTMESAQPDAAPAEVNGAGGEASAADGVAEEVDEVVQLREQLAAAEAKAADYLDKFQRSAAEFQNIRRRQEKQFSEEIERANAGLIRRLLPVLDDLELAFQNTPASVQNQSSDGNAAGEQQPQTASWIEGFRQIQKKLFDILSEQGVTVINTSGAFDPVLHEAIGSEPSDSVASGHIIAPVRAGYEYKGRVLRPALVRVAL
jgi:molecular chaperone GrpE